MPDTNDRDTLIRMEQQLKDSVQNQALIHRDLKEIFQRIEKESKVTTTVLSDLKGHVENSSFRWSELGKKLDNIEVRIHDIEIFNETTTRDLNKEKESRVELISTERLERQRFEQDILATVRTAKWFFGIITGLATILAGYAALIQVLKG